MKNVSFHPLCLSFIQAISFIPDGRHIVGVASDTTINIWDSVEDHVWSSWKDTRYGIA